MLTLLLLLSAVAGLGAAKCECGYSVQPIDSSNTTDASRPWIFTDGIETDFTKTHRKLGADMGWIPQEFNVSAKDGRGPYGRAFVVDNVVPRGGSGEGLDDEKGQGLELVVGDTLEAEAVTVAEIDTARLDLHWGSYRAGMKVTNVNGTCAAFFWVSSTILG